MSVHKPYCNCFECSTNSVDGVIGIIPTNHVDALNAKLDGMFIHSNKSVTVYSAPDGQKARRTVEPGKYIGKVQTIDSKTGWITINNNLGYIRFSNDLTFVKPDPNAKPLTNAQLADAVAGTLEQIPGGEVISLAKDASSIGSSIINFDWLGNLKWLLIGIVVILILIVVIKIS